MNVAVKPIEFAGDALDALRAFPITARREAGYQLDRVQRGLDPESWKPMTNIGLGVRELRVRSASGAFRVIYFTRLMDAVYVLHCFQKKSERTARSDMELATKRYKEVMRNRK